MKERAMMRAYVAAALVFAAAGFANSAALAWDQYPGDEYLQRSDSVTLGAGDAKEANAVTHIIDPWHRYVGDTRIPGNGERMSGAIERYQDISKLKTAPPPIRPIFDPSTTSTGTSTSTQ
jgi:hypothetical protein